MTKWLTLCFFTCGVLAVVSSESGAAEQVPLDRIQDVIREGCEQILTTQRADGALVLDPAHFDTDPGHRYCVGVVSLGVLSLEHALPHLKGETAVRAGEAVRKGLAWISQQTPEQKTYSAGLAISALYQDRSNKYQKLIGDYAEMLILSQVPTGNDAGSWSYDLCPPLRLQAGQKDKPAVIYGRADNSNAQLAVLGLLLASQSGYQVPRRTWTLLRQHYMDHQNEDGGWGYAESARPGSYSSMTLASTISLAIADEMLFAGEHKQCEPPPPNRSVERGLQWIGENLKYDQMDTYAYYAMERLGILSGLSEFGGKPWFDEGAARLVKSRRYGAHNSTTEVGTAFAVLFLSRGLEPIIINKLKRTGDWNNDPYDIKHLTEYISTNFQHPKQWRLVTLNADVDFLLRVPILYISGHDEPFFTTVEKAKLKEYVEKGGTLFAMACCSKPEFDKKFRSILAELWPDESLQPLPKNHPMYVTPRPLADRQELLGLALGKGQGRLGVIYSPNDLCCRWHMGGTRAKPAFDVGANIYFYVDSKEAKSGPGVAAGAAAGEEKK